MSSGRSVDAIKEHGTPLDEENKRIRCCYCLKVVRGFNRLKHHLGGVGTDVTSCSEAPAVVKVHMRNDLLEKKKERLIKEMGALEHPELPLKRNFSPSSSEQRHCQLKRAYEASPSKVKNEEDTPVVEEIGSSSNGAVKATKPTELERGKSVVQSHTTNHMAGGEKPSGMTEDMEMVIKEETLAESRLRVARSIRRFFFDADIDPVRVKLPSFQRVIDSIISYGKDYRAPDFDELRSSILQNEVSIVNRNVENMRRSWGQTGCSILLDVWTDQRGQDLIRFLVACSKGTVFHKSFYATRALENAHALFLLINKVVEDIGAGNIIQVVSHDKSKIFEDAGKLLMQRYPKIFWALCVDYGMDLIFEKFERLEHFEKVLGDAKTITRYIYSHELALYLLREHMQGGILVRTSDLKSVASFLTLRNMVSERENLINMFSSTTWNASDLASTAKGKNITKLVKDPSFWAAANEIQIVTAPLIDIWSQIGGGMSSIGFYYNAMDRAKLQIQENLGGQVEKAAPYWRLIDQIWSDEVHSPLHAAGYFLNPQFFYSDDFYIDAEVTSGVIYSIMRLSMNLPEQELIVLQLDAYREAAGTLGSEKAIAERFRLSPDLWWLRHGGSVPQLQRLAVRILSQTCRGSARYMIWKGVTEQLHANRRTGVEQSSFIDLELVHSNQSLWDLPFKDDCPENLFCHKDVDPSNEWVVEES